MKQFTIIFSILAALLLIGSHCQSALPVTAGAVGSCNFYFWKTELKFSPEDKALADSLGMKRLYLRHFDVDWSPTLEMPVPVGEVAFGYDYEEKTDLGEVQLVDYQIIPTVFFVNRVFEKDYPADSLAAKISSKIAGISEHCSHQLFRWGNDYEEAEKPMDWDENWEREDSLRKQFLNRITEIQLDCDWTPATRKRYFAFLEAMKRANPGKTISCTVRLHQFRDKEKAGIPPVGRGTLMCYNVAPPKDPGTVDAIFDPALVLGYLKNGDYPLPLEAALPLFSWGALFHENQFKGLAAGLAEADLKGNPLFAPVSEGKYRFTQDTVFANVFMREGDLVRMDEPNPAEIMDIAQRLAQIKAVKTISFFDWNPSKIRKYHVEKICKKFEAAR